MLERDVIRRVVKWAQTNGVLCARMHMGRGVQAGYPDYLMLLPNGKSVWMEFKGTGGKLSELQRVRIAQLRAQGQLVYVISDPVIGVVVLGDALGTAPLDDLAKEHLGITLALAEQT